MRQKLRTATAQVHEALDEKFSSLALSDRTDFIRFLMAHGSALNGLSPILQDSPFEHIVSKRLQAIQADLRALGRHRIPSLQTKTGVNALGVAYVIAGSHLGQKILKTRWQISTDETVLAAGQYFDLPNPREDWLKVLDVLGKAPPDSEEDIVEGALYAFRIFSNAFDQSGFEK